MTQNTRLLTSAIIMLTSLGSVISDQVFVVRRSATGDLFTVDSTPADPSERFYFTDNPPAPTSIFSLNSATGMVSRVTGAAWNSTVLTLSINRTTDANPAGTSFSVIVQIVDRGDFDPILSDVPAPLWTTIPNWIRPGTVIYTVHSIDKATYGADVRYRLESGDEGKFSVNPMTGEVYIVGRQMFLNRTFSLAISAQIVGSANNSATSAQVVNVAVGDLPPQLYLNPYNISVYENSTANSVFHTIGAKSFQNLPLRFAMTTDNNIARNTFSLDPATGALTLRQTLVFAVNQSQYRFNLTVTEQYSNYVTSSPLTINLMPVNHAPYFRLSYHVVQAFAEDSTTGTVVLNFEGIDVDPWELGRLTYTVDNPLFGVQPGTDNAASIVVRGPLDYDYLSGHKYEFNLTATDGGQPPLSGSTTVQVWMKNVNDEVPVFEPVNQTVRVKKGALAGFIVHNMQAFDPDGDQLRFQPAQSSDGFLSIDTSGQVSLIKPIPTDSDLSELYLPVNVYDNGSCCTPAGPIHSCVTTLKVEIIGVNTQPTFPGCRSYDPSIPENSAPGTVVLQMTAQEQDSGVNSQLAFFVVFQSESDHYFEVRVNESNPKVAELYSRFAFDRESPPTGAIVNDGNVRLKVTVKVQDNGSPPLSTNCFLFVRITDINDFSPTFDYSDDNYKTILFRPDATPGSGSRIYRVFATDRDTGANGQVSYALSGVSPSCANCFTVDPAKGWITRGTGTLNTTNYYVRITASDGGNPPRSTIATVTVTVTDDQSRKLPVWQQLGGMDIDDYMGLVVVENSPVLTLITNDTFKLFATVAQSGARLNYFLANTGDLPSLNSESTFGQVTDYNDSSLMVIQTLKLLDASNVPQYTLRCRAFVGTSIIASVARLVVTIQDVNDKYPQFQGMDVNGVYPAAVSYYSQPNDFVIAVTATDLDTTSPNNKVAYSFDPSCGLDCTWFTINSTTGEIRTLRGNFDANNQSSYSLIVLAADGAPPGRSNKNKVTVLVRVIGSAVTPPKFSNDSYSIQVNEGLPRHTNIANITAIGVSTDLIQYEIKAGNQDRLFAVDSSTGMIYTVGELLYAKRPNYTLVYLVSNGADFKTTNVIIDLQPVNLYPPFFTPLTYTNNNMSEKDTHSAGQLLATVTAFDPDAASRSGSIVYNLYTPQATTSTANSPVFTVSAYQAILQNALTVARSTGSVSFSPTLSSVPSRDFPIGFSNWLVNVAAVDESGGPSGKTGYGVISIQLKDINDNSPMFDTCCVVGSVLENSAAGSVALQLVARDPDNGVNGTVSYSIVGASDLFQVSSSGSITTKVSTFDRETQDTYYLTVRAQDGGVPSRSTDQFIMIKIADANDNPPVFVGSKSYAVTVPEQMPVGSLVLAVMATDDDIGINARRTYTVPTSGDAQFFYADSIYGAGSGVIRIKRPIAYSPSKTLYTFTVQVSDGATTSDTATVAVSVFDINDHAPAFSVPLMNVSLSKLDPVNKVVATVTATDAADFGNNANFSYYVDYYNTDRKFNFIVDPQSGVVRIRNTFDPDVSRSFDLGILAVDKGTPAMTGSTTIHVTITDANDNPPSIKIISMSAVGSGTTQGQRVSCFTAQQANTPPNVVYTFNYVCNSALCRDFTVQPTDNNQACLIAQRTNGYSRSVLGFSTYTLTVNISDNGSPRQWAVQQLTVVVESRNEHPAKPGDKTVVVNTYNGKLSNTPIGNVYVDDVDDWDLPDRSFTLASQPSGNYFSVNGQTGQVTMLRAPPQGVYVLSMTVMDTKPTSNTFTCTVNVVVNYLNDTVILSSGSMRFSDVGDASSLFDKGGEKLNLLKQKLATLIGTSVDMVDILAVRNAADTPGAVDVTFAAHGSPYYTPEKLNSIVWMGRTEILQATGLTVDSSPVDLCRNEYIDCWNGGCTTQRVVNSAPLLVNSNSSSFVGIDITYVRLCNACSSASASNPWAQVKCGADSCLNGGICNQNWDGYNCTCPLGFEGPRCQQTRIRFTSSSGYALLKPLQSCENDSLRFEFMTKTSDNQLLFYVGPMLNGDETLGTNFMSIELVNRFPKLRINLGDGEVMLPSSTATSLPSLNNGVWHTVEVFRAGKEVRLVVDHCAGATITETIDSSMEDRSQCDFRTVAPGGKFLLSTTTPVQLGGRTQLNNPYPAGLASLGFTGCIKNVEHNGELYDLHLGTFRVSRNAEDGCSDENCGTTCPGNSTCIGNMNNQPPTCICYPGLRGSNCDQFTMVKELREAGSYVEWFPQSSFSSVNQTLNQKNVDMTVTFRTRQTNGIIFFASSFTKLEHAILEIVNSHLQFRYDLGSDDHIVSLPNVNVSDGMRHVARVERHGNQVILRLDSGEGRFYAERWPANDEHRMLRLRNASAGGEVLRNKWTNEITVQNIIQTCIQDVRYGPTLFPMDPAEYTSSTDSPVTVATHAVNSNCLSNACGNIACSSQQYCYDMWRVGECRCADPTWIIDPSNPSRCVEIGDCSVDHCYYGDCAVDGSTFTCHCWNGFGGRYCNESGAVTAAPVETETKSGSGFNREAAIAVPVVIGFILLVLLILLILFLLYRRRRPDYLLNEPDQDIRENVVSYDEEGAGEEDIHAYDLSRLQKPIDPDLDSLNGPMKKWPDLNTMSRSGTDRPQQEPGSYPEIGDYIADRLQEADDNLPPSNDSLHGFNFEGASSKGGSLSSVESGGSDSSADQDFGFLNNWGPPFRKLADLYGNDDGYES